MSNPPPSSPTPSHTSSAADVDDLLYGFDTGDEETRSFLSSVIASGRAPRADLDELRELSLMRGVEEWDMLFACAAGLRESTRFSQRGGDDGDEGLRAEESLVSYLGAVLAGRQVGDGDSEAKTGKEGGQDGRGEKGRRAKGMRRVGGRRDEGVARGVSHFWGGEEKPRKAGASQCRADVVALGGAPAQLDNGSNRSLAREQDGAVVEAVPNSTIAPERDSITAPPLPARDEVPDSLDEVPAGAITTAGHDPAHPTSNGPASSAEDAKEKDTPRKSKPTRGSKSPFFTDPPPPTPPRTPQKQQPPTPPPSTQTKPPRPPRGTISSLPIPPLSAPRFGLIQEELAHDPFALLIAITFLIRTTGKAAIPVFRQFIRRWPTPEALAAADEAEMVALIKPLGLSRVRCAAMRRYASGWLARPPGRGRRFGVRNYPRTGDGGCVRVGEEFGPEDEGAGDVVGGGRDGGDGGDAVRVVDAVADARARAVGCAWEIGHLTQGSYALDSWRIFCRDVLLGRAENWTGKGAPEGFQPEWMRVLPRDKELRACLRWMWMREGWEWDPLTGEREPLREEMRRAVDEGHVGYDDTGSLVILHQASNNAG